MKWIPCSEKPEGGRKLLVTNNLEARDAYGEMSHLWLVNLLQHDDELGFLAYTDGDTRIENLTHWRYALPPDLPAARRSSEPEAVTQRQSSDKTS